MEKYNFLEHTGDAKFQAFGDTLEEAFSNAAMALVSLMWEASKVAGRINYPVSVEGRDLEQLLLDFLEEILYLQETKHFLLHRVENLRVNRGNTAFSLKAVFKGDDASRGYDIFGEVKAVTYHEMEVREEDRVMVQVVVDL